MVDGGLVFVINHFIMKCFCRNASSLLLLFACLISPGRAAEITFSKQNGKVMLSWPSDSPAWRLQYTTNLASTNWIEMDNFTITNNIYTVVDTPGDAARFYRLCQRPASQEQPPVLNTCYANAELLVPEGPGGVTVGLIDGSYDIYFDASDSTDPRGGTLGYHWVIATPTTAGYSSAGITGYHSSGLVVLADSIPDFTPQTITFSVTLTHEPFDPYATTSQSSKYSFRVLYKNSALTLLMSTACQQCTELPCGDCQIEAALKTTETP